MSLRNKSEARQNSPHAIHPAPNSSICRQKKEKEVRTPDHALIDPKRHLIAVAVAVAVVNITITQTGKSAHRVSSLVSVKDSENLDTSRHLQLNPSSS